jgi:hypothetical protein
MAVSTRNSSKSGRVFGLVRRKTVETRRIGQVHLVHTANYTRALEKRLRDAGWKNVQARIRPKQRKAILRKMKRIGCEDAYGNDRAYNKSIHNLIGGNEFYSLEANLISYLRHSDTRMDNVGSGLSKYYEPTSEHERTKWVVAKLLWLQDGLLNDGGSMHVPPHPQFLSIVSCISAVIRDRVLKRISMGMEPCGAHGYYPERFHKGIIKLVALLTSQ